MTGYAVVANKKDNVATAVKNITKGQEVIIDLGGEENKIVIKENIPFGHKFAIRDIHEGNGIIKYGESIGTATAFIVTGDYVHIHNIESRRGRGDLEVAK